MTGKCEDVRLRNNSKEQGACSLQNTPVKQHSETPPPSPRQCLLLNVLSCAGVEFYLQEVQFDQNLMLHSFQCSNLEVDSHRSSSLPINLNFKCTTSTVLISVPSVIFLDFSDFQK